MSDIPCIFKIVQMEAKFIHVHCTHIFEAEKYVSIKKSSECLSDFVKLGLYDNEFS